MKRVYWVVGVSSISGVLGAGAAACSSDTTTVTSTDDGGSDASTDTKKPPAEAAPDEDSGPTTCPTTTEITTDQIAMTYGSWQAPGAVKSVCTQKDIDAIKGLFADAGDGGSVKYTEMRDAVNDAGCGDCMFSQKSATRWGMYVEGDPGSFIDNRLGACFAETKDESCGKARFEWQNCIHEACTQADCVTATARTKCYAVASEGACKTITTAYTTACPNEKALIAACSSTYQVMVATCGGGPDGGLDASSN